MQRPNVQAPSVKPQDIILAVSFIAVGCIVYFLAMPQAAQLKSNTQMLQQKREQLAKLKQRADDLTRLAERIRQIEADIERLGVAYPERDQTIEALIQAQIIASRTSMTVETLTPSAAKAGQVPVAMSVSGRFADLPGFLRQLNDNLRPILVKSVSVTAAGDKERPLVAVGTSLDFAYAGAAPAPAALDGPPIIPDGGLDAPPINERAAQ